MNFDFEHSSLSDTYTRALTIALDNDCRITLSHFTEAEDRTWWATCSNQERDRVRELSTASRVATYEAESESIGLENPHCKFAFFLPPENIQHSVRYAVDGEYSAESQELISFFLELYDRYPPSD